MKRIIIAFMMLCVACMASAANYLTFTAEEDGSTFGIVNNYNNPDVQYSLDGGETWTALTQGDTVVLAHKGDRALLKGNNPEGFSKTGAHYSRFKMTGKVAASGSVMSLIDGVGISTEVPDNCFYELFKNCTSLTQAPELPATTLADNCYWGMFSECTGLTQAPELPATTLADNCYCGMFDFCTSLTQAPELPATTLADYCYMGMFENCTSLTQAPELPATTLTYMCYYGMFSGCTSLTQAPALPATTLAEDCYGSMFSECTGLTQAPELPATTLSQDCYGSMFSECTGLTQAPELPATTLARACYGSMFKGCTSLTQAPELPATKLTGLCYIEMFSGCTSLTQAPELPATILEYACYWRMFKNCTSLTQAPELPATTLSQECYAEMFSGCTNLTEINVSAPSWSSDDATSAWVTNVAPTGTFICPKALALEYGEDRIPEGWTVKYIEDQPNYLTFKAEEDGSSFGIVNDGDNNPDVQYSLDGGKTWNILAEGDSVILVHKGDKALLKGDNPKGFSNWENYSSFTMTGKLAASGSVMSLIDGVGLSTEIPNGYCFCKLFRNCTSLTQAPALSATTLSEWCYWNMFSGCTSLTQAPELPATTLAEACYSQMFLDCTGLTQAPELPATTLPTASNVESGCYGYMFEGCTSLTQAPALPATTLAEFCYLDMFRNCTNLTQAPALPATTLAEGCYAFMFYGCTSLTRAPKLPATTLVDNCYRDMFMRCTSLSEINVSFTSWSNSGTAEWVENVAPTGTFICPKGLPLEYGESRIPEGWMVEYAEEVSVASPALADDITVWTDDLTIFVCGAEGEVSLYDMSGRRVAVSNSADEERALCVPAKGAYVVRTSGGEKSVLVR